MYRQADPNSALHDVIRHFRAPIRFAFAYGSGVFKQDRKETREKPLVDFILAVTHAQHWHSINLQQNPHHYSGLRYFGSGLIAKVQENLGAGVYFNPYVEINGMRLKYGVVSLSALCSDLVNWDTLYLAGRMQKPLLVVKKDPVISITSQVNLTNAIRIALLLLPPTFTEFELYSRIVGLSYTGDLRMKIAEDPNKVRNIVIGQQEELQQLYRAILTNMANVSVQGGGRLHQDSNPMTRAQIIRHLPGTFYYRLIQEFQRSDPRAFTAPAMTIADLQQSASSSIDAPNLDPHKHQSLGLAQSPKLTECTLRAVTRTPRYSSAMHSLLPLTLSPTTQHRRDSHTLEPPLPRDSPVKRFIIYRETLTGSDKHIKTLRGPEVYRKTSGGYSVSKALVDGRTDCTLWKRASKQHFKSGREWVSPIHFCRIRLVEVTQQYRTEYHFVYSGHQYVWRRVSLWSYHFNCHCVTNDHIVAKFRYNHWTLTFGTITLYLAHDSRLSFEQFLIASLIDIVESLQKSPWPFYLAWTKSDP
ncbi:Mitochondrial translocator assembly and maintenance protein 41 [Dimargaris verticillata]|uniref:Phosphatidate cytidylyltransferase, mitochondrial n=1 Tax=Dimargaris verticillata TaxID=2761393 RepID=A0A9W8BDS1_9FUNG|nr:Mitochondrial translocator assembly and maintenance protein 41 [Dimargaris verticillata]